MKYLKVWTSFRDIMKPLSDDEKGRLFDAMLLYAESFTEPSGFIGNERFVWPAAKQWIDLTYSESLRLTENGKKGGRPKTKENQTKPIKTNNNQTEPNKSHKVKEGNIKENNITEFSFISDDTAAEIQHDHDRVFTAAEDAGFKMSNMVRARLIALYADNGLDKMLSGFNECATHGAPNLAYLEAVLKGTGKKKPQMKVLPAQQYDQRDYSGVQAELMRQQDREIEEALTKKYGSSNPEDWRKGVNAELQAEKDREMMEWMSKESG